MASRLAFRNTLSILLLRSQLSPIDGRRLSSNARASGDSISLTAIYLSRGSVLTRIGTLWAIPSLRHSAKR